MLQLQAAQLGLMDDRMLKDFHDRVNLFLHEHFPGQCRHLGEAKVQRAVVEGTQRAQQHEFSSEEDVARYILLSAVWGLGFDTDARYPWARKILASRNTPAIRLQMLFDKFEAVVQR